MNNVYDEIKRTLLNVATAYDNAGSLNGLNHQSEVVFALDQVKKALAKEKNRAGFATNAFRKEPSSIASAYVSAASMGLSLNPSLRQAYLIPRDGRWIVDPGYQGYVHLAAKNSGLVNCWAEVVFAGDTFTPLGRTQRPIHEFDPFVEKRGELRGAYAVAILANGQEMVEFLPKETIARIKACSHGSGSGYSPWNADKWEQDMIRKSALKRLIAGGGCVNSFVSNTALMNAIQLSDNNYEDVHIEAPKPIALPSPAELEAKFGADKEFLSFCDAVIERCVATNGKNQGIELIADRFGDEAKAFFIPRLDKAFEGA
ncbi:RecT family recombinase [uncultured Umboniibacter sp.]|uniref:RecT family recombinase n=1 Tax=uncultured Umboniibacter sp. TaxID=1798917 RepID=UPI002626E618|nr:RecT family recombinase [uncultured Umboniibacter sp.]